MKNFSTGTLDEPFNVSLGVTESGLNYTLTINATDEFEQFGTFLQTFTTTNTRVETPTVIPTDTFTVSSKLSIG